VHIAASAPAAFGRFHVQKRFAVKFETGLAPAIDARVAVVASLGVGIGKQGVRSGSEQTHQGILDGYRILIHDPNPNLGTRIFLLATGTQSENSEENETPKECFVELHAGMQ